RLASNPTRFRNAVEMSTTRRRRTTTRQRGRGPRWRRCRPTCPRQLTPTATTSTATPLAPAAPMSVTLTTSAGELLNVARRDGATAREVVLGAVQTSA